jgi:Invasion associated locus B (IalB) protein
MNANRNVLLLPITAALAFAPVAAQSQTPQPKPGTITAPAQVKQQPKPTVPASAPAEDKSKAGAKPASKPGAAEAVASAPKLLPATTQPNLLGQYDNWGAYWAAPDGRKVCFAAARPNGSQTNRGRTPAYLFITSRPNDKVKDEVSAVVSFTLKSNAEATAVVGGKNFAMSSKADGVWIKNQTDEPKLVDAMRKGGDMVLKATTDRGLQSTDTFSMKGLAQALDRIARECK